MSDLRHDTITNYDAPLSHARSIMQKLGSSDAGTSLNLLVRTTRYRTGRIYHGRVHFILKSGARLLQSEYRSNHSYIAIRRTAAIR